MISSFLVKQLNELIGYFVAGFNLLKKAFLVFLVGVFFEIVGVLIAFSQQPPEEDQILFPVHLILVFLGLVYVFISPLLFDHVNKGEKLTLAYIFDIYKQNFKRSFLPAVTLLVVTFLLFMTVAAPITFYLNQNLNYIQGTPLEVIFNIVNPTSLLTSILFYMFIFMPIIFQLEKLGIWESLTKSVSLASKNLRFIALIIVIMVLVNSVAARIPIYLFLGSVLKTVVLSFMNYLISASALLYYQKNKNS